MTGAPSVRHIEILPPMRFTSRFAALDTQLKNAFDLVTPRFRTMWEYREGPGNLRAPSLTPPSWYSTTSVSVLRPPTDLKKPSESRSSPSRRPERAARRVTTLNTRLPDHRVLDPFLAR